MPAVAHVILSNVPSELDRATIRHTILSREGGRMYYTYILRSENFPDQTYVGSTSDLRKRLDEHNSGKSIHTNKFKPWALVIYIAFLERRPAERFERYLKSGSGRAFANRHLYS